MTRPRRHRTDPTCLGKRRFGDETLARAQAMVSIQERWNVQALWIYHCPHCDGWHLTSKGSGRRLKVTAENPVHVE